MVFICASRKNWIRRDLLIASSYYHKCVYCVCAVSPIAESALAEEETLEGACQQLTQGLLALSADDSDPFSNAPFGNTATAQVHATSQGTRL